jgi:hypothetical protein
VAGRLRPLRAAGSEAVKAPDARATLERHFAPEVLHALDRYIAEQIEAGAARTDHFGGKPWLTTVEAGEALGCTPRAVRMRVKRGRLAGRYQGSRLYVSASSVLDLRGARVDARSTTKAGPR